MKQLPADFACLGGTPTFGPAMPLRSDGAAVTTALRGIYGRRFYANHGPLSLALDSGVARCLGQAHGVSVVNLQSAAMLLMQALQLQGEVLVSAWTRPGWIDAMRWCDLQPRWVALTPDGSFPSPAQWLAARGPRTSAVLLSQPWGQEAGLNELSHALRGSGLRLIVDVGDDPRPTHADVDACVLAMGAGDALDAGEAACVACSDDRLADVLRTMRSFHPSHTFAEVSLRSNTKISEAQAALGLASLEDLATRRQRFQAMQAEVARHLDVCSGLRQLSSAEAGSPWLVLERSASGQALSVAAWRHLLQHEGLQLADTGRGFPVASPEPVAAARRLALLKLPLGQFSEIRQAEQLAQLLNAAGQHAKALRAALCREGD